jgi:hypothetical protein
MVRVRRGRRWVTVRRCVRLRRRAVGPRGISPGPPTPGGPTGPAPLFEPPGQRLDGEAAKPFLQRYLLDSTFTDCPAGWGVAGCSVEQRYSHHADSGWHYCRLTTSSGSDVRSSGSYTVQNATVNADGSWAFDEYVDAYGSRSAYEWHIATDGTVTGLYSYDGSIEQLGPLRYVAAPKDCSY